MTILRRSILFVLGLFAIGCSEAAGPDVPFNITRDALVLAVGERASLEFSAGQAVPVWSSRDPSTVEVSEAELHARAPGVTWVYGAVPGARDSLRVTVRSTALVPDMIRARIQDDEGVPVDIDGWSVWRRRLVDRVCCIPEQIVGVTELGGVSPESSFHSTFLGRPDFADLVDHGDTRRVPGYVLSGTADDFYFAGPEGIVLYMPSDRGSEFSRMYVPVDSVEFTTVSDLDEAFPEGDDLTRGALTPGRFRGTASFDAASFLVESHEPGRWSIVDQLADTAVSVFVEFDTVLRKWIIGDGELNLRGSRYAWGESVFGQASLVGEALGDGTALRIGRINTGQTAGESFESNLELWIPTPTVGTTQLVAGPYDTSGSEARARLVVSAPGADDLAGPNAGTAVLVEGEITIDLYAPSTTSGMGLVFGSVTALLEFEDGPSAGDRVEVSSTFKAPILPLGYKGSPWSPGIPQ